MGTNIVHATSNPTHEPQYLITFIYYAVEICYCLYDNLYRMDCEMCEFTEWMKINCLCLILSKLLSQTSCKR